MGSFPGRSWGWTVALLLGVAGLIALNRWIYFYEVDATPVMIAAPKPILAMDEELQPELPSGKVELGQLGETLKRPLFRPGRRPYVPKVAVAPPESPKPSAPPPALPPGLQLIGIIGTSDGHRAVIRMEGATGTQSYAEGAMLGAWMIASIRDNEVVLSANGESKKLRLFSDAQSPQRPAAVPGSADLDPVPKP